MTERGMPKSEVLERWLEKQRTRDPALYRKLAPKLSLIFEQPELAITSSLSGPAPTFEATAPGDPLMTLETIVREGRPALFIKDDRFTREDSFISASSSDMVERLESARVRIDPMIPLIGRIDVINHATGLDFLGTGWLVAEDILVTNRHVAELLARRGADRFEFIMGRFGDNIEASVGYGHERNGRADPTARVLEVVFIEPTGTGPDIAFVRVERHADGTNPTRLADGLRADGAGCRRA